MAANRDAQRAQLVSKVATLLVNRKRKKKPINGRTFNKKTGGRPGSDIWWGA